MDQLFGLWNYQYPEDKFNRASELSTYYITEAISQILNKTKLTVDFWIDTISNDYQNMPCNNLCDYLNTIFINKDLINKLPKPLHDIQARIEAEIQLIVNLEKDTQYKYLNISKDDTVYPSK